MQLRRELLLTIGALVGLNVLLAFGVIGLFARTGSAVASILEENVASITAAETMIAMFAARNGAAIDDRGANEVRDALRRAQENVTEPEERPALARIASLLEPALGGDAAARTGLVEANEELISVNRIAMRSRARDAQRIGSAGAWSAVFVGVTSFLLSLLVVARLSSRFLRPLGELHRVLQAVRRGEPFRRCRAQPAPIEVRQVVDGVNQLLDERLDPARDRDATVLAPAVDAALVHLLEQHPSPMLLVDRSGAIRRANGAALEILASPNGPAVKASVAELASSGEPHDGPMRTHALPDAAGWLCELVEVRPATGAGSARAG